MTTSQSAHRSSIDLGHPLLPGKGTLILTGQLGEVMKRAGRPDPGGSSRRSTWHRSEARDRLELVWLERWMMRSLPFWRDGQHGYCRCGMRRTLLAKRRGVHFPEIDRAAWFALPFTREKVTSWPTALSGSSGNDLDDRVATAQSERIIVTADRCGWVSQEATGAKAGQHRYPALAHPSSSGDRNQSPDVASNRQR